MAESKTECEDRISVLADDLLVMILDLVPTKDAVSTMFLSKRWLSVWTMVRTLEYKDSDDDDESKKSVWWFLNKSLKLHNAPVIDTLCMELGPQCPTTDDVDVDLRKWVAKAVDCFVNNLKLKLLWSAGPISLPSSLYSCESLVELTLSDQILVNVPSSSSSAYLPSLTELELSFVVYKDDDSLVSFLSGCPVLESLFVRREIDKDDNVKIFTIKVPSLCELWYHNYSSYSIDHTGGCLVLDAPAMTSCRIHDFSGDSCSIEYMPCLEDARIDVECYLDDKYLTSLSSVLSLHMFMSDAMLMRCGDIVFSRLMKLSICPCGSDCFEPLLLLLGNAPKLKEFLVDCDYFYKSEDLPFSWNQPSHVPGCLSSELEVFEWREYGDRAGEEEFLTYILANSQRLKTATISLRSAFSLEKKELLIEELKDIPRVSTTSHLFSYENSTEAH